MKFKFLLSTLLFTSLCFSQNFHIGPELGVNVIKLDENKIGNNYQPSWHAGMAVAYDFTDWFSVRSGVFYTQKRQAFSSKDTSTFDLISLLGIGDIDQIDFSTYSEIEGRHTLNYIQLPIMGNFNWEGLNVSIGGYVGYQFSSRTRETEVTNTPFVNTIDIASIDPTGLVSSFLPQAHTETFTESSNNTGFNKVDFGIKGGIGYQMDNFGVNLYYVHGIPDYRSSFNNPTKRTHKYVQIGMNYMFDFGGSKAIGHSRM